MSGFLQCIVLVWSTLFVDWSLYLDPQFYCGARSACQDVYCDTVIAAITLPDVALFMWTVTRSDRDMRPLTTGIRSEKCVVKRFRRCANMYLHKPI
jgi:hypothetical protein